jgi:hypothetical protein
MARVHKKLPSPLDYRILPPFRFLVRVGRGVAEHG